MGERNKSIYNSPDEEPNDLRYEFWPRYLQISPSYHLAHKLWCNEATTADIPKHVTDFELVMETYEKFGDVFNRSAENWWTQEASKLFAPQVAGLDWKVHMVWQHGEPVDHASLAKVMDDYATITRPNLGNPLTLLASIPLDMRYDDILNSLRRAFRFYRHARKDVPNYQPPKPLYEIQLTEVRPATLDLMLDLVHGLASKETKKQWQVGFEVGVNRLLQRVRNNMEDIEPEERIRINVRVGVLQKRALAVPENAARGKFYDQKALSTHFKKLNFEHIKTLRKLQVVGDEHLFAP